MTEKLSDLINALEKNRSQRRKLEEAVKPLELEYKELKTKIMEQLDAQGTDKAATKIASVSISEVTVPVVEDVTKLVPFIARNKLWHLFLSQPLTTPAWREVVGMKGKDLPGTKTFVKRDINHASIKAA